MLIRPHPIFWRMVNGASIIYLMGLIFISMLDVDYVRKEFLPFMFGKELGVRDFTRKTVSLKPLEQAAVSIA